MNFDKLKNSYVLRMQAMTATFHMRQYNSMQNLFILHDRIQRRNSCSKIAGKLKEPNEGHLKSSFVVSWINADGLSDERLLHDKSFSGFLNKDYFNFYKFDVSEVQVIDENNQPRSLAVTQVPLYRKSAVLGVPVFLSQIEFEDTQKNYAKLK